MYGNEMHNASVAALLQTSKTNQSKAELKIFVPPSGYWFAGHGKIREIRRAAAAAAQCIKINHDELVTIQSLPRKLHPSQSLCSTGDLRICGGACLKSFLNSVRVSRENYTSYFSPRPWIVWFGKTRRISRDVENC